MPELNEEQVEEVKVEEVKEEPKELTEEEKATLERKRVVFRSLHDYFLADDIYLTEEKLGTMVGLLDAVLQNYQHKLLISGIDIPSEDEKIKEMAVVLNDCTLSEAVAYCEALKNALYLHRYQKTKELTVKDLDIQLL